MLRKLANLFLAKDSYKKKDIEQLYNSQKKISQSTFKDASERLQSIDKQSFIQQLEKGLSSNCWIDRLRHLIITHYLIRTQLDQNLIEMYSLKTSAKNRSKQKDGTDAWVSRQIVDYYEEYLQKICSNIEIYKEFKQMKQTTREQLTQIELISNCFKAVNLMNFILKSQVNLNKVGRYYPKLTIMGQLFNMYVQDIKIFYHQLQLIIDSILGHYQDLSNEMLRHCFIFLVEVQKTFDRLQEFFYNRYFYRQVETPFPEISPIDPIKYKLLVKYIRKYDTSIDVPRIVSFPTRRNKERNKFSDSLMDHKEEIPTAIEQANYTVYIEAGEKLGFQERFITEKDF